MSECQEKQGASDTRVVIEKRPLKFGPFEIGENSKQELPLTPEIEAEIVEDMRAGRKNRRNWTLAGIAAMLFYYVGPYVKEWFSGEAKPKEVKENENQKLVADSTENNE